VSTYHTLLSVHVLGAFLLTAGMVVAGAFNLAARARERPSEIAYLLGLIRIGVVLIGVGSLLVLVFGLWLAHYLRYGLGDQWVVGAIALWLLALGLGGAGGRGERKTRKLAERLAAEGDRPTEELTALVRRRPAIVLSWLSALAVLGMLVLMVWKPGAY